MKNSLMSGPAKYEPHPYADQPPEGNVTLERVHGFSAHASQGNVMAAAEGRLVFTAGAVAVVQEISSGRQSFFTLHNGCEIKSISIHPNKDIIATGARSASGSKLAEVLVWQASTK